MVISSKSLPPLPPCPSNLFDQGNTNHGAAQECSFLLWCRNSADWTDWCLGRLMASGFCELNSHGYLRGSWALRSLAPAFFSLVPQPPYTISSAVISSVASPAVSQEAKLAPPCHLIYTVSFTHVCPLPFLPQWKR